MLSQHTSYLTDLKTGLTNLTFAIAAICQIIIQDLNFLMQVFDMGYWIMQITNVDDKTHTIVT